MGYSIDMVGNNASHKIGETDMENTQAKATIKTVKGICPRCGKKMRANEVENALSRRDNETYICSPCGTDEALVDAGFQTKGWREIAFAQRAQGKSVALHAIIGGGVTDGYMIGVAVENESGYYPTPDHVDNPHYGKACLYIDKINKRMFGLTHDQAMRIVDSSMRTR